MFTGPIYEITSNKRCESRNTSSGHHWWRHSSKTPKSNIVSTNSVRECQTLSNQMPHFFAKRETFPLRRHLSDTPNDLERLLVTPIVQPASLRVCPQGNPSGRGKRRLPPTCDRGPAPLCTLRRPVNVGRRFLGVLSCERAHRLPGLRRAPQ